MNFLSNAANHLTSPSGGDSSSNYLIKQETTTAKDAKEALFT